jgi:dienelactone hydrolase
MRIPIALVFSALTLALFSPVTVPAGFAADIVTREISYRAGDVEMKGYLAVPGGAPTMRPGVLVVHEWWGHNEYARRRARMLAELGYPALAVDMYGDGKSTEHPKEAGEMSAAVRKDPEGAAKRFEAAMAVLKSEPSVDPERLAAIGYCFGGAVVLEMARRDLPLKGVVSFHGALNAAKEPAKTPTLPKILVLHGADDSMISPEVVASFQREMTEAGADWTMVFYGGAKHSFTNPDADKFGIPGLAYNAAADRRSWQAMKDFFGEIFAK